MSRSQVTAVDRERIVRLYSEELWSVVEISRKDDIDVTTNYVKQILREEGVSLRPPSGCPDGVDLDAPGVDVVRECIQAVRDDPCKSSVDVRYVAEKTPLGSRAVSPILQGLAEQGHIEMWNPDSRTPRYVV